MKIVKIKFIRRFYIPFDILTRFLIWVQNQYIHKKTALEARVIILPVQGQLVGRYRPLQEGPWEEIRDTAQLLAPESQPSRNQVSETVGNTSYATTTL